jgi:hypothetical protein
MEVNESTWIGWQDTNGSGSTAIARGLTDGAA